MAEEKTKFISENGLIKLLGEMSNEINNFGNGLRESIVSTLPSTDSTTLPPDDEIWYTDTEESVQTVLDTKFDRQIVSNTYENGKGIIKFDGPITTIGDSAFAGYILLTSIYIPDKVTYIGDNAFDGCEELRDIFMCPNNVPALYDDNVFYSVENIWVPVESLMDYVDAEYWNSYLGSIKAYIKGGETLISGKNLRTIEGRSLIGSGDTDILSYVNKNIKPSVSSTYDLGSNMLRWKGVYANTFEGVATQAVAVKIKGHSNGGVFPLVHTQSLPQADGDYMSLYTVGDESESGGIFCAPAHDAIILGNTSLDGEQSGLKISPEHIFANNLSDGFFVDTNGGNWSLGSASNNTCNISGYGGAMNLSAYGSDDSGYGMTFDATNGGILISPIGTIKLHSGESNIELATSDGWVNIESSEEFNVMARNIEIDQSGCYAKAFYETSDENLKDFTDDITVDFNKLKEIRKSYFTWKDGDQNLHIGTSAQDVQKIYPELVSEDNNGNLTVDYAKLSLVALAAVDKLEERISRIEKELNINK